jgi:hypothetical protein
MTGAGGGIVIGMATPTAWAAAGPANSSEVSAMSFMER